MFNWFKKRDEKFKLDGIEFNHSYESRFPSFLLFPPDIEKIDGIKVNDYVYHIADKKKHLLLDFSQTVDGLCYIMDTDNGTVGRCFIGSLKKIKRI